MPYDPSFYDMPCNEDRYREHEEYHDNHSETQRLRKRNESLIGEVKEIEILLCEACRVLTRLGHDFNESHNLAKWWDQHKIYDARGASRRALGNKKALDAIKIVDRLINQLNPDEAKLLAETGFLESPNPRR